MNQVQSLTNKIIRLINQSSVNGRIREQITMFLVDVSNCYGTKGSVIAETLLDSLARHSQPRCSDAQAKAVAETAYEYFINL